MATDFDAVRRQIAGLPEGADKRSILEFVAREEALEKSYAVYVENLQRASEKRKRRIIKERLAAFVICAPIASFFGFYVLTGLTSGRIKNFVLAGQVGYFSVAEFPIVRFADEPYRFCMIAFLYGSIALAFSAAALGIEYLGTKKRGDKPCVSGPRTQGKS